MAWITHLVHLALAVPFPIWVFAGLLACCVGTRMAGGGRLLDSLVGLGEPGDRDEYSLTHPEVRRG